MTTRRQADTRKTVVKKFHDKPLRGQLVGRGRQSGEFDRIARYFAPLASGFAGALDLKDDAAVLRHAPHESLIVTTDAMVAGVHFLPADPPADIAAKLLAVNLSDLAAMGADPYVYTLVTSLPKNLPERWLAAFAKGLAREQKRYRIALAGGDSVSTDGPITLTIAAFGKAPIGREVRRRFSFAPDLLSGELLLSGTIGDAALGLAVARRALNGVSKQDSSYLLGRLRRPTPRLPLVPVLRRYALAAIDISDGLVADVGHMAEVSHATIEIEVPSLPLSTAVLRATVRTPALLEQVLAGGDDYEIACIVREGASAAAIRMAGECGVRLTRIGRVFSAALGKSGVVVTDPRGKTLPLRRTGWRHF